MAKKKTAKPEKVIHTYLEALESFAGESLKEKSPCVFVGKERVFYTFQGESQKGELARRIFSKDPSAFISFDWIEKNKTLFASTKEGEEEILTFTPAGREKALSGLTPAALLGNLDTGLTQKILGSVRVIAVKKENVKEFIEI